VTPLDRYLHAAADRSIDTGSSGSKECQAAHAELWQDQMKLHRLGKKPGGDEYLLRRAFKHLKSHLWLGFLDDALSLPTNMTCHGLNKLSRKLRHSLTHWPVHHVHLSSSDRTGCAWLTHVFRTTLTAVAKSGIVVEHLEASFSRCKVALLPSTDLKFHPRIASKLTECFSKMERFSIEFRTYRNWSENATHSHRQETSDSIDCARSFARIFKNAKILRLISDTGPLSGAFCVAMVQQLELRKVTQLHLVSISINYCDLATILCHLGSAHTVSLKYVNLQAGAWSSILKVLLKLPRLNHLHLLLLMQEGKPTSFLRSAKRACRWRGGPNLTGQHLPATLVPDWETLEVEWPTAAPVIEEATSADPVLRTLNIKAVPPPVWPRPGAAAPQGPLIWNTPQLPCPERQHMFQPPGKTDRRHGRGTYVCLTGWEIGACLPKMIKQCHLIAHSSMSLPFPGTNDPQWLATAVPHFPDPDSGMPFPFQAPFQETNVLEDFDFDAFLQGQNNNFAVPPSPSEADTVPPDAWVPQAMGPPDVVPWTGNSVPAQGTAISPIPSSPTEAAPPFDWTPSNGDLVGGGNGPMPIPAQADTIPPPGWQPSMAIPMASAALGMNTMLPPPPPGWQSSMGAQLLGINTMLPPPPPTMAGPATIPAHAPLFLQTNPAVAVPMPWSTTSSLLPTDKTLQHLDLAIAPTSLDSLEWPPPPPTIYSNMPKGSASKSASRTIFPRELLCAQASLHMLQQARLRRKQQAVKAKRQRRMSKINARLRYDRPRRRQLVLAEASPSTDLDADDGSTPTDKIRAPSGLLWTYFSCALVLLPAKKKDFWACLFKWPGSPLPAPPAPPLTAKDRSKAKRLAKPGTGKKYKRYQKEAMARERKARSPWSPASVPSTDLLPKFGVPTVSNKFIEFFNHFLQHMTRVKGVENLDDALDRIKLELRLKYNRDWATCSKNRDKTYLRLEKDFLDCGGLLGPSDFLDGADEDDGAGAVENDHVQERSS
jgi:hypothetical protein